jgi:hypothetical protein
VTQDRTPRTPTPRPSRQESPAGGRRRYVPPRVVDYGSVSKLTQTGGITTKDAGNMKQVCL